MGFGRYRFRRSFGQVNSQFRGARPSTYPNFQGLLDLYPGAAAAYSLRALSSGWLAGDVVEVRRSSDSTTDAFTASQITNGEMLDWVNNGTTDLYNSARYFNGVDTSVSVVNSADIVPSNSQSFAIECYSASVPGEFLPLYENGTTTGDATFSLFRSSTEGTVFFGVSGANMSGVRISKSFTGVPTSGVLRAEWSGGTSITSIKLFADGVEVTAFSDTSLGSFTGVIANTNPVLLGYRNTFSGRYAKGVVTDYSIEKNGVEVAAYTGLGTSVTAWEDTIGSNDGTETNGASYTGQPFDGFVSTWYDQSGNANDATQITTTSQPKIVSAGALVTGGLDFDGVDDFFDSNPSLTQPVSIFGVYKALTNNSPVTGASPSSLVVSRRFSGRYIMFSGTALATGFHPSTEVLASCMFDGATSTGHWNGIEILSGDAGALSNLDYIGRNATSYLDGTMNEIIIYNSNQSANRVAIETNINDAYSIF